jgi:hypothetical protein
VLYTIDVRALSDDDKHLAAALQGIVNRAEPRIYCLNETDEIWLPYYEKEYGVGNLGPLSLPDALAKFAGLLKGYAIYSPAEPWSVDPADTFCALNDCVAVTPEQEPLAQRPGLTRTADFRGRWKNATQATAWSFRELYPKCSKKAVASIKPGLHRLRDYAVANRMYIFYLQATGEQFVLLRKLLAEMPRNIPVFGYIADDVVQEFISESALAKESKYLIASDFVPNLTVHSGIPTAPLPEIDQRPAAPPYISGKLAVVFAFSDGDNIVNQMSYYLQRSFWLHPERGKLKAAWSMAPELYELAPGILRYYYQTRTPNDFFVAMIGAGYTHPSMYGDKEYFARLSVELMKLTGLDILWTLDPAVYFSTRAAYLEYPLGAFARRGYVKGLLVGYTPCGNRNYSYTAPGYPPLLYSKIHYLETNRNNLQARIESEAADIPAAGKIVFFGVNDWVISYADLLDTAKKMESRGDIVFISPQEAFSIIEKK